MNDCFQNECNEVIDVFLQRLYNGNISQTLWKTANTDSSLKDYEYTYDALNRITSGIDNTGNYNLTSKAYDKNGNITNLERKGHTNTGVTNFGVMDDLIYSYDSGNKLMKVADAATIDQFGFKDDAINTAADASDDYSYDTNGNLKTDTNKGITSILYNHLNLPTEIKFDNSNTKKINYTYSADGIKLKKIVNDGGNLTTTDYANGYIYENNTLQFFNHPEGYVNNDNGTFKYVYNYLDHLGSIRLSYSDGDGNGSISQTEIIQENHYYPYGLKLREFNTSVSSLGNSLAQKYMFNGKEFDQSFNETLNTYDFGARNYDPALGRWMNLDPLAESFTEYTPYNAMMNNPIMFIDPDGRAAFAPIYGTGGEFLGTDDQGLQGKAIVMDKKDFKQGMSHDKALTKSKGAEELSSKEAGSKLLNHYNGLKSRPDYDGEVTIAEGIGWAKSHANADFSNPNNSLYLDASKLNFGKLNIDELVINEFKDVNLLNSVNLSDWSSIHTTYALGNTAIKLLNSQTKQVELKGDIYDWDYHNYDQKSGNIPSSIRDKLILLERLRTGLNDTHGVPIKIYGTGKLN